MIRSDARIEQSEDGLYVSRGGRPVRQLLQLVGDMLLQLMAPVGLQQAQQLGIQQGHCDTDVRWRGRCRLGPRPQADLPAYEAA